MVTPGSGAGGGALSRGAKARRRSPRGGKETALRGPASGPASRRRCPVRSRRRRQMLHPDLGSGKT
eukprot:3235310-Pyramimonas_sp.AAC.1